jgi:hypothetical protein
VLDAAGNPLAGVRLVCYNGWHRYPVVASKGGGEYDFAIIPEATVVFDPQQTCRYILDWWQVN